MVSSRELHPLTTDSSPTPASDFTECLCLQAGDGRLQGARGRQTQGRGGPRVCIVPLQGSRCYSPHSGQDPGVRSRGGQEGPCEGRRPHPSTDLPWLLQKQACRRSSPSATPPQGEDTMNAGTGHTREQECPSASFFICSPGGKRPRAVLGQICGQVPGDAGSGYTVFPKRGSYGHLSQGSPCPTSGEEAVGVP